MALCVGTCNSSNKDLEPASILDEGMIHDSGLHISIRIVFTVVDTSGSA